MLILLIGPKGSGKSHIGRLLEREFGVYFFHVEPHWMKYYADCEASKAAPTISGGIEHVRPFVVAAVREHAHVCIETTGASREILDGLLEISEGRPLLLVRVRAPLDLCLERVATRDPSSQISIGRPQIEEIHKLSSRLELPFDVTVDNVELSDAEILERFGDRLD